MGLGIQKGQKYGGLAESPNWARARRDRFLRIDTDFGDIEDLTPRQPCHSTAEMSSGQWNWKPYEDAISRGAQALRQVDRLINWGGDHGVGLATVSAFLQNHPDGFVLWVDAHADLNTPEASLTGHFHGMPVSFLLGLNAAESCPQGLGRLPADRLIYLGLRDLDPFEEKLIQKLGVLNFPMQTVRKRGLAWVLTQIQRHVGRQALHVSWDIDGMDPLIAAATGVPSPGGFSSSEGVQISRALAQMSVRSVDMVEVNPALGSLAEQEATFELAFQLLIPFTQAVVARPRLNAEESRGWWNDQKGQTDITSEKRTSNR